MNFSARVFVRMRAQVCGCIFGRISVCLFVLSRCAGMAVCCNASCFANCLRSVEGRDARLSGGQKKRRRKDKKYYTETTIQNNEPF